MAEIRVDKGMFGIGQPRDVAAWLRFEGNEKVMQRAESDEKAMPRVEPTRIDTTWNCIVQSGTARTRHRLRKEDDIFGKKKSKRRL